MDSTLLAHELMHADYFQPHPHGAGAAQTSFVGSYGGTSSSSSHRAGASTSDHSFLHSSQGRSGGLPSMHNPTPDLSGGGNILGDAWRWLTE